jgi:hypothetical protein
MATPRKIGGPAHRREINRAKRANHYARLAMDRILEERASGVRLSQLLADIAHQLGIELEAIMEMEVIVKDSKESETNGVEISKQAGGPEQKGE